MAKATDEELVTMYIALIADAKRDIDKANSRLAEYALRLREVSERVAANAA